MGSPYHQVGGLFSMREKKDRCRHRREVARDHGVFCAHCGKFLRKPPAPLNMPAFLGGWY